MTTPELADDGIACPDCQTRNRAGAAFCSDCGTILTSKSPRWDRRTRRRAIRLSTVVVVLVGMWLTFAWVQDTWYAAGNPVAKYFAGLEARDGYEPPTDVVIGETFHEKTNWVGECKNTNCYPDGDRATVEVTYKLAGKRFTGGVVVTRPSDGWFRPWSVVEPRGLLKVYSESGHLSSVQAAGETMKTQQEAWYVQNEFASLPPGVYTITVDNPLLQAPSRTVRLPIAGGNDAWKATKTKVRMPKPTITKTATATVQQMVRQKVERCIATTGDTPDTDPTDPGCGLLPKTLLVDDDTVRWTLEKNPKIKLQLAERPHWDDPPVEVVTTTPGKATMHYQRIQSDKDKTERVEFEMSGGVAVKDGRIIWPAK